MIGINLIKASPESNFLVKQMQIHFGMSDIKSANQKEDMLSNFHSEITQIKYTLLYIPHARVKTSSLIKPKYIYMKMTGIIQYN